jgi:hypothetical protein
MPAPRQTPPGNQRVPGVEPLLRFGAQRQLWNRCTERGAIARAIGRGPDTRQVGRRGENRQRDQHGSAAEKQHSVRA